MSTVQRIARNTTVLLVAQIASYLLAFFYMMYTARYLDSHLTSPTTPIREEVN